VLADGLEERVELADVVVVALRSGAVGVQVGQEAFDDREPVRIPV
jgi:hypothetical protein